jgi:hypothetical protein
MMNKYQKALNHLEDETIENFENKHVQTDEERKKIVKDVICLGELVEKATPEAPNVEHSGWRSPDGVSVLTFFKYKCPCCEKRITDIDKFCPNCGQAIDWGKR